MKTAPRDGLIARAGRAPVRLVLLAVVVGVLAVGCSDEDQTAACSDAAIDFSLPTGSFTDWASYADQLSVVTVLADRKLFHPPEPGAPPDKYVGRSVEIRVTETAWRRPSAPIAPDQFWMVTDFPGWLSDRGMKAVLWGEGPRLEISHRYLMALVRYDEGDWGAYPRATLPIEEDGRLADTCSERPTLDALAGLTVADAARKVAGTPPDTRAVAQGHLPPEQRYQTVQKSSISPD